MNIMQQNDHLLPSAAAFFSARLLAQCVPSQKSQVEPLRTSALWRPENQHEPAPPRWGSKEMCLQIHSNSSSCQFSAHVFPDLDGSLPAPQRPRSRAQVSPGSALLLLLPAALLLGTSGIRLLPGPGCEWIHRFRCSPAFPGKKWSVLGRYHRHRQMLIYITMYNGWFSKLVL